jgi:DNA-binding response OmpR family regulator
MTGVRRDPRERRYRRLSSGIVPDGQTEARRVTRSTRLIAGGIVMDLLSREVTRDGEAVQLSAKEFELLAHFLRHPNQVLSREQLLSAVWGYGHDPKSNIVEVYVGYLRRKLGRDERPAPIDTVRSMGYRLAAR